MLALLSFDVTLSFRTTRPGTIKLSDGEVEFARFTYKVTEHYLKKGQAELIKEYGHLLPALADVPAGDDDPTVIGCIAERPIDIMLACAAAAVGNQKYHEHFEMQCEADGEELPVDHIRLLMGLAADGVPFKTMRIDGIVEVSAFCSNLLGLSNSPECQWNIAVISTGEKSELMTKAGGVYDSLDDMFRCCLESGARDSPGIARRIRIPPNAKFRHSGVVGEWHTVFLHFSHGYLIHFDGKTHSIVYDGTGGAASGRKSGMRVKGLGKTTILSPDVAITDDPNDPLSWRKEDDIIKIVEHMRVFAKDLRTKDLAASTFEKKMRDEAARLGHGFTEHIPYAFSLVAFMGILHGDTIDATVQLESSDIHASEIERGAEFSGLLAGSKQYGLIKAGVALEGNKAGEKNVYRLGGEDGIKFLAMRHLVCAALKAPTETPSVKMRRLGILARMHIHRCMSAIYSRHSAPVGYIDYLLAMSNDMRRLLFSLNMHATYNTAFMFHTNLYLLKKMMDAGQITLNDVDGVKFCFMLAALCGEQGGERLHAYLKPMWRVLTNGREGCHRAYMRARLLMQIAGEQGPFNVPCDYKKGTRTRFYFEDATSDESYVRDPRKEGKPRPGKCSCCPVDLAAATTMTIDKASRPKHYLAYGFLGPLCADCYELAEFIHVCTAEEKPTGWVRSTLAEEEATRVADATALTVDVAKQRRALIVERMAELDDIESECSSSEDESDDDVAGPPSATPPPPPPPPTTAAAGRLTLLGGRGGGRGRRPGGRRGGRRG